MKACDQEGGNAAKCISITMIVITVSGNYLHLLQVLMQDLAVYWRGKSTRRKLKGQYPYDNHNSLPITSPINGDVTHREVAAAERQPVAFLILQHLCKCTLSAVVFPSLQTGASVEPVSL